MMVLQYLVIAFLILETVAIDSKMQSKECTFTKSKPNSCLYFVMKNDLNHQAASFYCFDVFNGAFTGIYNSYDEAIEVMKRYYWWAESDMSTPRLRFGMFNERGTALQYTFYNPLKNNGKDVDMNIWRRSFPDVPKAKKIIKIDRAMYDESFPYQEPRFQQGYPPSFEYMALKPATMKWSRANFNDKIPFICEVPRFPKAYCEPGWWLHMKSRSCFFLNTQRKNFQDAAMHCRQIGSNLASINDETENNMALKMIQQQRGYEEEQVWFGLRHEASRAYLGAGPPNKQSPKYAKYFAESLGYNVDGTPVSTYNYFGKNNQPDGVMLNTTENCILYEIKKIDSTQRWNDYPCATSAWSLCRKMSSTQPYHS